MTNTNKNRAKNRAKYRFSLTFPEVFTLRQLRNMKQRKVQYITIYKRIESALAAGTIREVGKFRPKAQRGRRQTVYALANVQDVALSVSKSPVLSKGELTLA